MTTRHQIDCEECGITTTGENERDAEINHLLHYRKRHASPAERTEINNQLAARGYDP